MASAMAWSGPHCAAAAHVGLIDREQAIAELKIRRQAVRLQFRQGLLTDAMKPIRPLPSANSLVAGARIAGQGPSQRLIARQHRDQSSE
jgi:hypothetical protein